MAVQAHSCTERHVFRDLSHQVCVQHSQHGYHPRTITQQFYLRPANAMDDKRCRTVKQRQRRVYLLYIQSVPGCITVPPVTQVLALWSAVGKMVPGWTLTRDTILRQNVAAVVQAVPSATSPLWTRQWQAAADAKMTGATSGAPTGVLPVSVTLLKF